MSCSADVHCLLTALILSQESRCPTVAACWVKDGLRQVAHRDERLTSGRARRMQSGQSRPQRHLLRRMAPFDAGYFHNDECARLRRWGRRGSCGLLGSRTLRRWSHWAVSCGRPAVVLRLQQGAFQRRQCRLLRSAVRAGKSGVHALSALGRDGERAPASRRSGQSRAWSGS